MHLRRPLTAPFLVAFVLLVVFLAGCGGGAQQSDDASQNGGSSDEAKKQQGDGDGGKKKKKKKRAEAKIALGEITKVKGDQSRVIVLEPSREAKGAKDIMVFRLRKDAKITLGGEEAEPADIQAGQQAQIEYVRKEERNRARTVTLFKAGETSPSEGGEQTG
ncbi:MAG: hypothetical protein M3R38_37505 [Actinomycetota bacterium]|nr:hypothetical protein [Actinomycetota bacterium]MDP9485806.1 hypothetical protein [Actinomycetota bacterium]